MVGVLGGVADVDLDPVDLPGEATVVAGIVDDHRRPGLEPEVARLVGREDERFGLVDATGSGPLFRQIPGLIRKQGTLVLYGHGHGGIGMEALNQVQWREPTPVSPVGAIDAFFGHVRDSSVPLNNASYGRYATLAAIMARTAMEEKRVVTWDEVDLG